MWSISVVWKAPVGRCWRRWTCATWWLQCLLLHVGRPSGFLWRSGAQLTAGLSLAPVYWNTSNPLFKESSSVNVVEVHLRDDIDFVCPYYISANASAVVTNEEYLVIYQVTKSSYDACTINPSDPATLLILNCSAPEQRRRFTLLITPFVSIPNVPEFTAGQTYYYISTSTGSQNGLSSLSGGVCLQHNLKLSIYVCCSDPATSTSSTVASTTSTTTAPAVIPPLVATNKNVVPTTTYGISSTPTTRTTTIAFQKLSSKTSTPTSTLGGSMLIVDATQTSVNTKQRPTYQPVRQVSSALFHRTKLYTIWTSMTIGILHCNFWR